MTHDNAFSRLGIQIRPGGPPQQKTTCPQCSQERRKKRERCLSVNLAEGLWHCHHCGWQGSLRDTDRTTSHTFAPQKPPPQSPHSNTFQVQLRPFTPEEAHYWQRYHITPELLQRYGVHSVSRYTATNRNGQAHSVEASPHNPIFAYALTHDPLWEIDPPSHPASSSLLNAPCAFKLYRPHDTHGRFRHLGQRPQDFYFGHAQLSAQGPRVLITGGEKDVLSWAYLGQPAICLNSETAWPPQALIEELTTRFDTLAIAYDADETGQRMAHKICDHYQLPNLELPPMQQGHKDISDYIAHDYPLAPLLDRLNQISPSPIHRDSFVPLAVQNESPTSSQSPDIPLSHSLDLTHLMQRFQQEPPLHLTYLGLPPVAMGYVVGPPKSGKTTFCEGLAFSLAAQADQYLGAPLHAPNPRVMLFALEEFWQNRLQRNVQQLPRLTDTYGEAWLTHHIRSIDETFPRYLHSEEEWALLDREIDMFQPSVVFIDSLSRLYSGSIEDSRVAQALTQRLRQLVQDHQILLILIHHTPKQLGRPLTIDSIAGSRVLAQEADFAIGLSRTPSGQRYLKPLFYRYAPEPE